MPDAILWSAGVLVNETNSLSFHCRYLLWVRNERTKMSETKLLASSLQRKWNDTGTDMRTKGKMRESTDFPGGSDGKESVYNADQGSIPGSGRSPREGNGNPLQYYCLETPMDRGDW